MSLATVRLSYFSGHPSLADSLDPAIVQSGIDADTIALTNANLVHILPNGQVAPDLATWNVSPNRLVYTFTIRGNARFSNGHPVTALDASYSIQRALAPSTRSPVGSVYLNLIRGAEAFNTGRARALAGIKILGRKRLDITITKPVSYFLESLAYPTADVLDPSVVEGRSIGSPDAFKNNYLTNTCAGNQGAGPFRVVCQNRDSDRHSFYAGSVPMYTFVPNPYYYGPRPRIRIELPGYRTTEQSYMQYLSGHLETSPVPTVFIKRWKGHSQYLTYPSSWVDYLTPNVGTAPFNNIHCRLAVAYAIDRETIARKIEQGARDAAYEVVPRGMLGYSPGGDNPHYNVRHARAELSRCPRRTVPFEFPYASPLFGEDFVNQFSAIAGMLRVLGMNVRLKHLSQDAWIPIVQQPLAHAKYQIVGNEWQQDYPDPQDYCNLLLRSGQPGNIGGWHDPTYDRLVDDAETTRNQKTRATLYIRAQHIALEQGAWISVTQHVGRQLIKPYVHGLIGSEAYGDLVPREYNWANVWMNKSRHT